ncbi:MAG: 50S ribosomal protein L21 [Armatimonadota bacterium]|nr:50S ribosomal protein L21 [bacterium]
MYAIIKAGGKQYRVSQNDVIAVNRLDVSEGEEIIINEVMLVSDDKGVNIGSPYVPGAKVVGKVTRHYKGRKVRGFTYKPKKDSHRRYGHRQYLTSVAITEIKS